MMNPRIRADHDALSQIAQTFAGEAEQTRATLKSLKQCQDTLAGGDWVGKGATAFYAEMNDSVLPTLQRLAEALEASEQTTQRISFVMAEAENEAAAIFRADSALIVSPMVGGFAVISSAMAVVSPVAGIAVAVGRWGMSGEWSGKGTIFKSAYTLNDNKSGRDPNEMGLEAKGKFLKGELSKTPILDGAGEVRLVGGEAGVQFGINSKGKLSAGLYGEFATAQAKVEGTLVGDQNLGWTGGLKVQALAAEGFVGIKDNSIGGSVGVNIVSLQGETGANIAGYNVGVTGEVGLKFEVGFQIGEKTKIKLGPFSVGFNFGKAKD